MVEGEGLQQRPKVPVMVDGHFPSSDPLREGNPILCLILTVWLEHELTGAWQGGRIYLMWLALPGLHESANVTQASAPSSRRGCMPVEGLHAHRQLCCSLIRLQRIHNF
jgi:hypothetical protein